MFSTPQILKEIAAQKNSKYKIETLNPEKKLTFKIVSFNEIVEQLANRINEIAVDLEPYYFIDPSDYNSLTNKIKVVLNKSNLIENKKLKKSLLKQPKISKNLFTYKPSKKKFL